MENVYTHDTVKTTAQQLDQLSETDWDKLIDGLCADLSSVFAQRKWERACAQVIEMPVRQSIPHRRVRAKARRTAVAHA